MCGAGEAVRQNITTISDVMLSASLSVCLSLVLSLLLVAKDTPSLLSPSLNRGSFLLIDSR